MGNIQIASFRPGVVSNGTAFEAQALIYKYIQRKYGWRFTIFKDDRDNYFDPELGIETIPYHARQTLPRRWAHIPRNIFAYNKHVVNRLKGFDIILGCDPTIYGQGVLAAKVAAKFNIPLAFDASLTIMGAYKIGWVKYGSKIRQAMDVARLIWIPTPKTAERFRDIGLSGESISNKFVVLGHPVDTEHFKPDLSQRDKTKKVVLCVARLVMEKGVHYLIEAMAPIIKQDSSVVLRIVGGGEAKGFLQRIAQDEGIAANVEFVAPVPHADLPKIYNQAHLFVGHPVSISDWEEFFGVVNVEAMACGLPVVTSHCGGISHLAREEGAAFFVAERDIIGATQAIRSLLYDEKLYQAMSGQARKYAENKYSLPVIAEKYKTYLDSLITLSK